MSPRFLPTCELCENRTVPLPRYGSRGRRPCGGCPGLHAVCQECAEEFGLVDDYHSKEGWKFCPDAVRVVRELMRREGGEGTSYEKMARQLTETMQKTHPDVMEDFTQSSVAQAMAKALALAAEATAAHLDEMAREVFGDLTKDAADRKKDEA